MRITRKIDLINKPNIININKKEIAKHSISPKHIKEIIEKINNIPLKIKDKILFKFFMEYYKPLEKNLLDGQYTFKNSYFVNIDDYPLPSYYSQTERCFVCNFLRPIPYLSANDIAAHLLYHCVYQLQFKQKKLKSDMLLPILTDFYSTIILLLFGRKENLISEYNNLGILRLVIFKYTDKQIFGNKESNLHDYVQYLNKTVVRNMDITKEQIQQYDAFMSKYLGSFKDMLTGLHKLELLSNVDSKIFISTIYRRYGMIPLTIFDTPDRVLPFLVTLNFQNIINNNFRLLTNDKILENTNKYIYYQYSQGGF